MPAQIYWEYYALLFGRKLLRPKALNACAVLTLKEYNSRGLNLIIRGCSPFGGVLRFLESQWNISLKQFGKHTLRRQRIAALKRYAHNFGVSINILSWRRALFTPAPYLWLPREYVLCIFRFRSIWSRFTIIKTKRPGKRSASTAGLASCQWGLECMFCANVLYFRVGNPQFGQNIMNMI